MLRRITLVATAAFLVALATTPAAMAGDLDDKPALKAMLEEMRVQLDLTDGQVATATGLIEDESERAKVVVDELDDVTFDSVLDLLVEARAIREDFLPKLRGILDEKQKKKLKSLPKSDEIYIQAGVAWIADEKVDKLRRRLGLSEGQVPRVREIVTEQVRDSVEIVDGVKGGEGKKRQEVLDVMVDLRGAQRRANRELDGVLDDEQKVKLEQLREKKERK